MTLADHFRVGSNTKTMTATVILQLVQEVKLRLDGSGAGQGLGIVRFGPAEYGHDGQIPGFKSFMGHDRRTGDTTVVATHLAAVPGGEGAALELAKTILRTP
jgi:hypothetical protein